MEETTMYLATGDRGLGFETSTSPERRAGEKAPRSRTAARFNNRGRDRGFRSTIAPVRARSRRGQRSARVFG